MKRALSFCSGLMLALMAVLLSVAGPALQPARFERAVLNTVNAQAVGMSESDLTAFARHTMAYLRGREAAWKPQTPFVIPESFTTHMAEVKGWVDVLKVLLPAGLVLCFAGLWLGRNSRAAGLGMLALIFLIAAMLLWAAVDFHSLWMVIHRVLIPGGIFPAGELVMQLFPLELFFSYIVPVLLHLACWMAAITTLVLFSGAARRPRSRASQGD